jgi:hypothetical protein
MGSSASIQDLSLRFARAFSAKNLEGIGSLLTDDFTLYDPALKQVKGKEAVLDVLRKQFDSTKHVVYEVINAYEDGNVGILEFKITFDDQLFIGVDFLLWHQGKMTELRCYYNPPKNEVLKPLSSQAKSLQLGGIYEHFKGKRYKLLYVAHHSESLEECAVYQALYGAGGIWVRPLRMFLGDVALNGKQVARFKRVESC